MAENTDLSRLERGTIDQPAHESSSSETPYNEKPEREEAEDRYSDSYSYNPPPLDRRETDRLSRTSSRLSRVQTTATGTLAKIRSRAPIAPFTHALAREKTGQQHIVDFDGPDDPYRPLNWTFSKKLTTTCLYGLTSMTCTFASSITSSGTDEVAQYFGVGTEVSLLTTSLFLAGLGLGPLLWAPLSELYGRKLVVLLPVVIGGIFAFAAGSGANIQTLMICRFWQGFFGSAPVTNTGGVLGDIWRADSRGGAMVLYALAVVGGPTLGPVVGGAIVDSYLGWRWTNYINGIFTMAVVVIDFIVLDESYPPKLLSQKAKKLRHETGNWALHAKHEEWDASLSEMANKYLVRPFQLLATPICFCVALYASFLYGLLYACLAAFPYVFQTLRGWNSLVGSLPFLALLLGIFIASGLNFLNQKYYVKRWEANDRHPVPEARLPPMMFGSFFFAGGLFMFGWSGAPPTFWLVPCVGIVLLGIGFFTIFQAALNYLVDTFQRYSASAIGANTFLRSTFATAFPLFVTYVLEGVGVGWGMSIFAFIATLMIPIPFIFFFYGERIRARGKWSKESVYNPVKA